jgi:hypothetical protein
VPLMAPEFLRADIVVPQGVSGPAQQAVVRAS